MFVVLSLVSILGRPIAGGKVISAASFMHSLVVTADGNVYGWGKMNSNEMGTPDPNDVKYYQVIRPLKMNLPGPAIMVAAGSQSSHALMRDGTVYSWGRDYEGQLGSQAVYDELYKRNDGYITPTPTKAVGLSDVKQIDVHQETCLALKRDGSVWMWGKDGGMSGVGRTDNRFVFEPKQVPNLPTIREVSTSGSYGLAVSTSGKVYSWGYDSVAQTGRASEAGVLPVGEIPGLSNVVSAIASVRAGIALKSDGTVWVWGGNFDGQFGNGKREDNNHRNPKPAKVPGVAGAVKIASSGRNVFALLKDGTVRAWGNSDTGNCGCGKAYTWHESPTKPALSGIKDIFGGLLNSFAVDSSSRLWYWGHDIKKDHGRGGFITTPVQISVP